VLWVWIPYSNAALSLRNNRFRRDPRSLEEDEEMWFDQEEDGDDGENIVPMTDMIRSKLDADLELGKLIAEPRRQGRCTKEAWWL